MKPRGGEGQNGRLKCLMGFLVLILRRFALKVGLQWVHKPQASGSTTNFDNAVTKFNITKRTEA